MYQHKVHYYETDKMGVTHHSNYIRWMEEARVDYLDKIGFSFARIESMGILSPVVAVSGEYKKTTTFSDVILIDVSVEEFRGVKLKIRYEMKNESDEIVFVGHSEHCFLNQSGSPIRMKKEYPDLYQVLVDACD